MKKIAISSIAGGAGTTTVVAELASALVARKQPVIAVDLSAQNTLRLHFGMEWNAPQGLLPQLRAGAPWHEAAYRCENGVIFFPHGHSSAQDRTDFAGLLQTEPDWLNTRLDALDTDDSTVILLDCPASCDSVVREHACRSADLVLTIISTDSVSYATLADARTQAPSDSKVRYLINGFDPTRKLDRDIARLMHSELEHALCPVRIHRDESVREALAYKLSVGVYAPYSQAAADFVALATWLSAKLSRT